MPKSITRALPSRAGPVRAFDGGGNGTLLRDTQAAHLVRIDMLLESLQHQLDVQLQRIADLQAQLDRSIARETKPL